MEQDRQYDLKSISLLTGYSLVLMAIVAGVGYGYAFSALYTKGNAFLSFTALEHNRSLLLVVIVSFVVIWLLDLLLCRWLYLLFTKTALRLARLMALLRAIYTVILGIAIAWLFVLQFHVQSETHTAELAMYYFEKFAATWSFGLIFFGLHLLLLGLLLLRTKLIPRVIGYTALLAGACYMITNMISQLWADYATYSNMVDTYLALPMAAGELLLAGWLIVKSNRWLELPGRTRLAGN